MFNNLHAESPTKGVIQLNTIKIVNILHAQSSITGQLTGDIPRSRSSIPHITKYAATTIQTEAAKWLAPLLYPYPSPPTSSFVYPVVEQYTLNQSNSQCHGHHGQWHGEPAIPFTICSIAESIANTLNTVGITGFDGVRRIRSCSCWWGIGGDNNCHDTMP